MEKPYTRELHEHRLAAWAASRAASASPKCRFTVEKGFAILEKSGFDESFKIDEVYSAQEVDVLHKEWRKRIRSVAKKEGVNFSHGVAAKLINCYIKTRFVCGGLESDKIKNLHPPIDSILLKNLRAINKKKRPNPWGKLCEQGWSNFDSKTYEKTIKSIRDELGGKPMWKIEEHWDGFDSK